MPKFTAEVELRFEAESLELAGQPLRLLAEAAQAAGFELVRSKVTPATDEDPDRSGWTGYAPLDS